MIANLITLLLGLVAAISYGLADFLGARASKQIGPITSAFCVQAAGTIIFSLWYAIFVHTIPTISWETFGYIVASAVLLGGGACALYVAFEIGPVSLASPLSAAYPLVTALLGVGLLHAPLSGRQMIGIIILVLGIMTASGLFGIKRSERRLSTGPKFALLATVLWGIGFLFLDQAINAAGWQYVSFLEFILILPVIGGVLWLRQDREKSSLAVIGQTLRDPFVVGAGIMQMLAGLAVNLGFTFDLAAGTLVVAISSTYPVLTMVLAFKHFKERLETWALAGAIATIAGVILLLV